MKPASCICTFLLSLPATVTAELCQSNESKGVMHRMTERFDREGWAPRRLGPRTEVPEPPSERHGPNAPLTGVAIRLDG